MVIFIFEWGGENIYGRFSNIHDKMGIINNFYLCLKLLYNWWYGHSMIVCDSGFLVSILVVFGTGTNPNTKSYGGIKFGCLGSNNVAFNSPATIKPSDFKSGIHTIQ